MKKRMPRQIAMLIKGMESKDKIDLLISATRMNREPLISALHDHFCHGKTVSNAAALNGIDRSNMNPAINRLNKVAAFAEKYHALKLLDN